MGGSLQRTRGFRLEKVKTAPADGEKGPRVYKFRANDGEYDRYQDRLSVQGWKLDAFNANPVILYNHDAGDGGWLGLGAKDVLPIGKGRAYVEGNALFVDIEFDQDDEFAKKVESKVEKGILNAVSVRYTLPADSYRENERGGLDSDAQELLEISIVTIPGNQRALRVKGLEDLDALFDALTERRNATKKFNNQNGETMTPEQIAQIQKNAAAEALAAFWAEQKAEAEAATKAAEAAKAREVERQALKDELKAELMGEAQGARSVPVQFSETVKVGERASKGSGMDFVRYLKAQHVAKETGKQTADILKSWGYSDLSKALSSGSFAGMGSLIRPEYSSDFIELLRNETVIRKAGARSVPVRERLEFDGQATAASAAFSGETSEIAKSNPTTNKPLVLVPKKLTALAVIPNDLMRAVGQMAEQFVLRDILQVVALKEDEKFLYGAGSAYEPQGITSTAALASSHIYAMTALGSAGNPTVGEVKAELRKALKRMEKSNQGDPPNFAWIMSPSPKAAILDATGPGGDGANMLELEYARAQTLCGKKAFSTNQIPESSTADFLGFNMDEVIIGDGMEVEAESFPNGHWSESGTAKSGISTDQSVIRVIKKVDIGLRHNTAGVKITGVTWGI